MICLRNSRSVLSRLVPHKPTAVWPLPAQALLPAQYHYASGVPRVDHAASRPSPQVPSRRHFFTSQRRELFTPFLRKITSPFANKVGSIVEVVPYTNRRRFNILSRKLELLIGDLMIYQLDKVMGSKFLPPLHPDSVRVSRIASEIVHAVDRGLADRRRHKAGADMLGAAFPRQDAAQLHDEDEERRNNSGEELGEKPPTSSLLDGWEVIVVHQHDRINAMCAPGGYIIVFTGLLDKLKEDAENATVLGHEIGHLIARHKAETVTKFILRLILHIVTLEFLYEPDLERALSMPSLLRMMETEADHIGLLLLAAAGYDPRVAPLVYEKIRKIQGDDRPYTPEDDHPPTAERVQFLSQADIMNEALELYRGVRPCQT